MGSPAFYLFASPLSSQEASDHHLSEQEDPESLEADILQECLRRKEFEEKTQMSLASPSDEFCREEPLPNLPNYPFLVADDSNGNEPTQFANDSAQARYQLKNVVTYNLWNVAESAQLYSQYQVNYLSGNYATSHGWLYGEGSTAERILVPKAMRGMHQGNRNSPTFKPGSKFENQYKTFMVRRNGYQRWGSLGKGSLYATGFIGNLPAIGATFSLDDSFHKTIMQSGLAADQAAYTTLMGKEFFEYRATQLFERSRMLGANRALTCSQGLRAAASLAILTKSTCMLIDQIYLKIAKGEPFDTSVVLDSAIGICYGFTGLMRSLATLEAMQKAQTASGVYEAGTRTVELSKAATTIGTWLGRLAAIVGLYINLIGLIQAIRSGNDRRILSMSCGLASSACFFVGLPQLASGPLAPVGGVWCVAGFSLMTVQYAVDNQEEFYEIIQNPSILVDDYFSSPAAWMDIKGKSQEPLRLFFSVNEAPSYSFEQTMALMDVYGVNENDNSFGDEDHVNARVMNSFANIAQYYLQHWDEINSSPRARHEVMVRIYEAWHNFSMHPRAQAALLVLLKPFVFDSSLFNDELSRGIGGTLAYRLKDPLAIEFEAIMLGNNAPYIDCRFENNSELIALLHRNHVPFDPYNNDPLAAIAQVQQLPTTIPTDPQNFEDGWMQGLAQLGIDANLPNPTEEELQQAEQILAEYAFLLPS
jgi:hypothetical protein